MNQVVQDRLIRARILEAMADPHAWRVEADRRITRKSDGLWIEYEPDWGGEEDIDRHYVHVGSIDHGAAQASLQVEYDDPLVEAWEKVARINDATVDPERRPILAILGIS